MPFEIEKARRVKRFIETYCTFSKGEWAGKPFELLPWQWEEIIKPLFGTINGNGYRQYRTCYCEVPKKQGKTECTAAISLYMLTNDGEDGAEVYMAASDREQASICYQAAANMVSNSPDLSRYIQRRDSRKRLIYRKKNSYLQVLSSESYCVHPDTMFDLITGDRIRACNIKKGMRLLGWNNKNFLAFGKVISIKEQPLSTIYQITTNRGRDIKVTEHHKFLTMIQGERPQDLTHEYEWKEACELIEGDRVKIALGWPNLINHGKELEDIEAAWVLGAWIGDGECGRFRFINEDDSIVQRLRRFIETIGGSLKSYISTRQKQKKQGNKYPQEHLVKGNGKGRKSPFREWLKQHYPQETRSHTKRIPNFMWSGGQVLWAAFLAGWMDTDGCIPKTTRQAKWCSVSPGLLLDGQEMLARLGINSIVWRNLLAVNGREQISKLYVILSPFMSNVNKLERFKNKSKMDGDFSYHANYADRISSIKILEPETTISVEIDKIDTHVTNGIITHNSKHGLSPSCVIVDEIHAHPTGELYETLTAGTDYARRQQVVFVITTAGVYDKTSIWWKLRTRAQQVKAGIIKDPRFLPVLYLADPEKDDPEDEELWKRVNPSLGQIFTLDKIRQDFNEAKNDPIDFQNFKRFRLNIPIRQLSKWMPMDKWDLCASVVPQDELIGRRCYGGLDLSLKLDMTAFVMVFEPDENGMYDILCKFYCPEEGIMKRSQVDRVPYNIWEQQGFLTATPGATVDYTFIEKDISDCIKKYNIEQIGFDPWKATSTYNRIMAEFNPTNDENGFQMVEIRQGAKSMHEPAQDLLVNITNRKVRHGGNPVLRWNMDNMVMRADSNENLAPDKGKAVERIDGGVALIMAWGRMLFAKGDLGEPDITFI